MSIEEDRKFFTNFKTEIKQTILAIETFENAIIVGDRGSGKTSFLNHIYHRMLSEKKVLTVRFSTFGITEFNQVNFLNGVFNEIASISKKYISNRIKLKNTLIKILEPEQKNLQDYEYEIQQDDFYVALDRLISLIEFLKKDGVPVCILLDDTDKIEGKLIWNTLRGIRDPIWKLKVPIILTALPNQVNEITKVPLDHFFPYVIKLNSLDFESSFEMIDRRMDYSKYKIKIPNDVMSEIVTRASGNPQNLIEIFKRLFEELDLKETISIKHLESMGLLFSRKLPNIERAICNYLIHNPNTSASSPEFAEAMGVSRSRLSQILNKLKKQGIIGYRRDGRTTTYFLTSSGKLLHDGLEPEQRIQNEEVVRILPGSSTPHDGKYLEPEIVHVNVGDKVVWINEDTAAHTVTSGNSESGADGHFDSSLFVSGASFSLEFDKKGTYPYFCMVHPWMQGKIIVD